MKLSEGLDADEVKSRYQESVKEIEQLRDQLRTTKAGGGGYVDILQKMLKANVEQGKALRDLNKVIEGCLHREIHVHMYRTASNDKLWGPDAQRAHSSPKARSPNHGNRDNFATDTASLAARLEAIAPNHGFIPGPGHAAENMDFGTELNYAAFKGNVAECARLLSEHPEWTNLTDADGGWTAMHFAASECAAATRARDPAAPACPGVCARPSPPSLSRAGGTRTS